MNKFIRKHYKEIFVSIAAVLSVILICCALMLIDNFSTGLYKQAVDAVDHYSESYQELLGKTTDLYVAKAQEIVDKMPSDRVGAVGYVSSLKDDPQNNIIAFMRFYIKGQEYDAENALPTDISAANERLRSLVASNTLGCTGFYDDPISSYRVFGIHVPMKGRSGSIESVCVYFQHEAVLSTLKELYANLHAKSDADYLYVCAQPDEVIAVLEGGEIPLVKGEIALHDKIFTTLRAVTDKSTVDAVETGIESGIALEVQINGTRYVVCAKPTRYAGSSFYFVSIYNSYNVYAEGHALASALGAIIVVVVLIIIGLAVYILLVRFRLAKKVDAYDKEDPIYGCPTFIYFSEKAEQLLEKNKVTKYAIVYTEIAHFSYIDENFGSEVAHETLKYLVKIYNNSMLDEEVFARINDDHFALMLHFTTMEELQSRLKVITSIAYHCPALKQHEYYLRLNIGICCVNREENNSIQKMLDRAIVARRVNIGDQPGGNIRIYSEEVHENFMHEAEIEAKMEAALRNGEFKMFYQPKYNVERNRPDGCEALVRWYDAENNRFRPPSEFLPLFETNGFISNLDRYVMAEVCKFIQESNSRGYRMIPISVNVSRVTASKEGFLEYYIDTKKRYGIRDRFLTIEFTESFAYENYDVISKIVSKFHQNGFECSIDDFGSGFSSYNILKELPMDEIKLDRFFIKPGISRERDDCLLKSIITLAKEMNMKVTQEGVETVEDLKRLKEFGCDVIQGYIYAKPMAATDFLEFIRSGGSIHIV